MAAQQRDQLLDGWKRMVAAQLALTLIVLETFAVATQRVWRHQLQKSPGFVAHRLPVAKRQRDTELVEQVNERRLAGVGDLASAERRQQLGKRASVVERAVRLAGMDPVVPGEIPETATGTEQRRRERQRVIDGKVAAARELGRHASQNREVEPIAVVGDENVGPAEIAEHGPDIFKVGCAGDVALGDSMRPEGACRDWHAWL